MQPEFWFVTLHWCTISVLMTTVFYPLHVIIVMWKVNSGYTDVDNLLSIIQWNQQFVLNNRSNTFSFLTYSQKSYYKYLILVSINNYTATSKIDGQNFWLQHCYYFSFQDLRSAFVLRPRWDQVLQRIRIGQGNVE